MADGQDSPEALLRRAGAARDDEERASVVRELHARTDRAAFDAVCALARSGSAPTMMTIRRRLQRLIHALIFPSGREPRQRR
jgi:hypothetical protein